MRVITVRAIAIVAAMVFSSPLAFCQDYELELPPNADLEYIGHPFMSVDIDGDRAVIGGFLEPGELPAGAGSVWVYERHDGVWELSTVLTASNAGENRHFGSSVAIDGDRILVGAVRAGNAYLFEWDGTTWNETVQFAAVVGSVYGFGASVEFDDERVGILSGNLNNEPPGHLHVFEENGGTWEEVARLTSPGGQAVTASLEGNRGFIGEGYRVFSFDEAEDWGLDTTLNLAVYGGFKVDGASMIGCTRQFGSHRGAYVLEWNGETWEEAAQLLPAFDPTDIGFGTSCDLEDGLAVVGTEWWTTHVFAPDGAGSWEEVSTLYLSWGEGFSGPVAIDGDRAISGNVIYEGLVRYNVDAEETAGEPARSTSSLYPNPSSGHASIEFILRAPSEASVEVFDALGRRVADSDIGVLSRGFHRLPLDVSPYVPGVYLVRITTGSEVVTHTLTVVR